MHNHALLFVTVMTVALAGCGLTNQISATSTPCDLSTIKIKSVSIDGDQEGFVSRAVRHELYKYGAQVNENGVEIVGSVLWYRTGSPMELSIEVPTMSFASVARTSNALLGAVINSEQLAESVAKDFCECSAAETPTEQPTQR